MDIVAHENSLYSVWYFQLLLVCLCGHGEKRVVAAVDTDCTLILPAIAAIKLRFRVSKLILGFSPSII